MDSFGHKVGGYVGNRVKIVFQVGFRIEEVE